jgi:hypothetical protein
MRRRLCTIVVMTGALALGPATAHAVPAPQWPTFDQRRLQQIVDVFAAQGVTVCPEQIRAPGDITGSSAQQAIVLFASKRRPSCPQHRSIDDPAYNLDEERATNQFEAFLNLDFYTSQKAFDRGVHTWKRQRLRWPIVGWSWKPVVLGLNAGYPDVVEAVLKAMTALPGRPKLLFDNS